MRKADITVQMGAKGRMVLPAHIRKALDLQAGDRLVVAIEEPGVVRLTSAREIARRGRGMLGPKTHGMDLAKELIEERRKAAERESGTTEFRVKRPAPKPASIDLP